MVMSALDIILAIHRAVAALGSRAGRSESVRLGRRKTAARFLLALVVFSGKALAGGIQIHELSASAIGTGGAFAAVAANPSAIYFNPAGLSFQSGTRVLLGTTVVASRPTFRVPANGVTRMENNVFFPSYLYVASSFAGGAGFGFGVYNPYGLKTEWPADWVGRFLVTKASVTIFYLNPTVSFLIGKSAAIGLGFDYILGSAELERRIELPPVYPGEGQLRLQGDGNGFTGNLGFLVRPSERWSVGVSWRGRATVDVEGKAIYSAIPESLAAVFPGGEVSTKLRLPDNFSFGLAYSPNDDWVIAAEFQLVRWSTLEDVEIHFRTQTANQEDFTIIQRWKDGEIVRLGAEHHVSGVWKVRAGFFLDLVPSADEYVTPLVPEADRTGLDVGFRYKVSTELSIDVTYLYVASEERTIVDSRVAISPSGFFNGTYHATASMFALNLEYNL